MNGVVSVRGRRAAWAILFVLVPVGILPVGCGSSGPGAGDAGSTSKDASPDAMADAATDASARDAGDAAADGATDANDGGADGKAPDGGDAAGPIDAGGPDAEGADASDSGGGDAADATMTAPDADAGSSDGGSDATVPNDSGASDTGPADGGSGVDGAPGVTGCGWGLRPANQFQSDAGLVAPQQGMAHGDLNGDGKEDVAWIELGTTGSNAVEVMLGNGDGTFEPATAMAIGGDGVEGGGEIAIGDVSGDGKPDLVLQVSSEPSSSALDVLLGNGDGTFQPFVETAASGEIGSLTLGDLNGDGKLDAVVVGNALVSFTDGSVTGDMQVGVANAFVSKGDGTFEVAVPALQDPALSGPAVLADLRGDGREDLVVSVGHSLDVLLGNGDGTFGAPTAYPANGPAVAVGDWNSDGKPDIAFVDASGGAILLGNGDGTFQGEIPLSLPPSTGESLTAADVDGNGTQDLVVFDPGSVPGAASIASVFLGKGNGTFEAQRVFPCGDFSSLTGFGATFTLGDFNGDGLADAVCAVANFGVPSLSGNPRSSSSTTFVVLLGDRHGVFHQSAAYAAPSPSALAAGDVNGDGKPDLVTVGGSGSSVSVLINRGGGAFEPAVAYAAGSDPDSVALSDLNADGHLDAVVANGGAGTVSVLLGGGDGTFGSAVPYAVGANPSFVAVGDLNGDHKPDLVVANASPATDGGTTDGGDTVSVLLGAGNGTFEPQTTYAAGSGPAGLALADFNGDGRLDVAVVNEGAATVGILLGNGDGTLGAQVAYETGLQPSSVAAGDLNGDGKIDLAVANTGANSISVLDGNGDGTFQPHVAFMTGTVLSMPSAVAVADVDGDGTPDLVASDPGGAMLDVLHGNGDGTFASPAVFPVGTGAAPIAIADLDGDGALDVAVGSGGVGNVTVFLACAGGPADAGSGGAAAAGAVTVTPSELVFEGSCAVGPTGEQTAAQAAAPQSLPITVTNTGSSPVAIRVSVSEPGAGAPPPFTNAWFTISVLGETDGVLGAGQSATVVVTPTLAADPTSPSLVGTIAIQAGGDAGATQTVRVAEGQSASVAYRPDISFGDVPIGTSVSSSFACPNISGLESTPETTPNPNFSVTGSCAPPSGGWTVTFTPTVLGPQSIEVPFFSSSTPICSPASVTARGTGVPADAGAADASGE